MTDKPRPYVDIGERLQWIRSLTGLNQVDFAKTVKAGRTQYQNWEGGISRPKIEEARRIRDTYGATLDFIFIGNPDALEFSLRRAWMERPQVKASQ